jgi:hypothetical protein
MAKTGIYYMVFFGTVMIGIMGLIFYRNTRGSSPEDPCEIHKELFVIRIDSGVIKDKYVDRENHAMKTVILNTNDKDYELLFIPYDNWTNFDTVKVNDIISKPPNSFVFSVNNQFKFELKLDCKYELDKGE